MLVIRETQTTITIRYYLYYFTPIGMSIIIIIIII